MFCVRSRSYKIIRLYALDTSRIAHTNHGHSQHHPQSAAPCSIAPASHRADILDECGVIYDKRSYIMHAATAATQTTKHHPIPLIQDGSLSLALATIILRAHRGVTFVKNACESLVHARLLAAPNVIMSEISLNFVRTCERRAS